MTAAAPNNQKIPNNPKIMVIKHGALGDMVQALDGFASLRAGHPNAHLSLLTTAPFAGFARAMPFFDDVLIDPRAKPWISRRLRKCAVSFSRAGHVFMIFNHRNEQGDIFNFSCQRRRNLSVCQ